MPALHPGPAAIPTQTRCCAFVKNLGRNFRATGLYFLLGVLLSALFQRYVPSDEFAALFGKENEGFGVLMAATVGVPLYACGGGTIPLLRQWLVSGISMGSAAAFMITGPATKITNLGALNIVLGMKRFVLYLGFVMAFALLTGLLTNLIVSG
ncbi:MAG: permease [Candidatus Onthomonas sp.]